MRAGQSRQQKGAEGDSGEGSYLRATSDLQARTGTRTVSVAHLNGAIFVSLQWQLPSAAERVKRVKGERERGRLSPSVSQACSQLYNNWGRVRDDIH